MSRLGPGRVSGRVTTPLCSDGLREAAKTRPACGRARRERGVDPADGAGLDRSAPARAFLDSRPVERGTGSDRHAPSSSPTRPKPQAPYRPRQAPGRGVAMAARRQGSRPSMFRLKPARTTCSSWRRTWNGWAPVAKCAPPLRSPSDQEACVERGPTGPRRHRRIRPLALPVPALKQGDMASGVGRHCRRAVHTAGTLGRRIPRARPTARPGRLDAVRHTGPAGPSGLRTRVRCGSAATPTWSSSIPTRLTALPPAAELHQRHKNEPIPRRHVPRPRPAYAATRPRDYFS